MTEMKAHSAVVAILCSALSVILLCSQAVGNDQLESGLNAQFANKLVIVRGFYAADHLRYDASGAVLGKPVTGSWTAYAMLQVKRASVKPGKIILQGKRILNVYDTNRCLFGNVLTDVSVELEVEANTDSLDTNQALAVLAKIISTDVSEMKEAVPDYWKPWFAGRKLIGKTGQAYCGTEEKQSGSAQVASNAPRAGVTEPRPAYTEPDGTPVFRVAPGIKPPRARSTPDPEYNEIAKRAKFQGTSVLRVVVNERGEPTNVRIDRPLGAGLDDKAIEAVQQWRFAPGTYNGNPVAVEINVEMNFRLN